MEQNEKMTENTTPLSEDGQDKEFYDDIEVVVGENTIRTRQPKPDSRRERYLAYYKRRRKMLITLSCVVTVLALLFSLAWYFYSPVYGFGDLSENVSNEVISKARTRFTVEQYYDKKEGIVLSYNIYIPFEYDRSKHYPLMFCIADSASVGTDIEKPLNTNFGGAIWATEAEQEKHPCFVVVPCYPEKAIGDGVGTFTRYTDLTGRMIDSIVKKYNINASEVYATGQGMGASMLLYMAADEPDRFASLLIVDGGVEIAEKVDLSASRFVYIAAGGDSASLNGQQMIKDALAAKGVAYGELNDLNAEAPVDELNAAADGLFAEDCDQNFITWRGGSVGFSLFYGEQRISYRYGYKVDVVRDWVFEEQDLFHII